MGQGEGEWKMETERFWGNTRGFASRLTQTPEAAQFHLHNYYELYLLLEGELNFYVHHSCYPIRRGALLLLNDLEVHKAVSPTRRPHKRVHIHISKEFFRLYEKSGDALERCFLNHPLGEKNRLELSEEQVERFMGEYQRLEEYSRMEAEERGLLMDTCLIRILSMVNRLFDRESMEISAQYPDDIRGMLDYLDEHLTEPVTLEALESAFSLSRYHICHTFKRETGTTVMQYLFMKRVALAKRLLNQGSNVTETCFQAGFSDYTNFITKFRQVTGMTPKQYQMDQKRRARHGESGGQL